MANLFLCHASEDKPKVEPIHLALVKAGHSVFYDDRSLHPGADYQQHIYEAIEECAVFIFIASKASLRPGKFTLSELDIAQSRWPDPTNRVLPVVIEPLDLSELPSYLAAVTVLQIRGNAAVEVRVAVERLLTQPRKKKQRVLALTLTIGSISLAISFAILRVQGPGMSQPLSPTRSAMLSDASVNYNQSAFRFDSNSVVSWGAGTADIGAHKQGPSNLTGFFLPYAAEPYNHPVLDKGAAAGIQRIVAKDLSTETRCPSHGYAYHWFMPERGAVYCVRARDGLTFAVVRVTSIEPSSITFDYAFPAPAGAESR